MTANGEVVGLQKRASTVKGPEGNIKFFAIGKDIKNLDQIRQGDQILLLATRALGSRLPSFEPKVT